MKIPIVGEPAAPNPGRTFAPLDSTTFDQVGRAGAAVGQAVEGIGETKLALSIQMKAAIDQGTLAKAETEAETHYQAFVDSLKDGQNPDNNDPSTFQKRWADQSQVLGQQLAEDNGVKSLGSRSRVQFQTDMAKFKLMTTQSIGHIATQKAIENGIGDIKTNYETKLNIGDVDGAEATVKKGMATGLLNPEEGKMMIHQIPLRNETNQAIQMMMRDPDTGGGPIIMEQALKEMNADGTFKFYPHVVGQHREALAFDAYKNARMLQSQTAAEYARQSAAGEQIDPGQVNRDLALGKITKAQSVALLKPSKVFTPENYAKAVSVISDYNPQADPTHEKEAQIWASLNEAHPHLSPAASERLNTLFKEKLNNNSPLNKELAKDAHAIIEENFRLGVYGKFESKHQDAQGNWVTSTNPKVLAAAQVARADAQTQLNEWLKKPENQDATPKEAAEFVSHINKAQRRGALWAPVINPITGKAGP